MHGCFGSPQLLRRTGTLTVPGWCELPRQSAPLSGRITAARMLRAVIFSPQPRPRACCHQPPLARSSRTWRSTTPCKASHVRHLLQRFIHITDMVLRFPVRSTSATERDHHPKNKEGLDHYLVIVVTNTSIHSKAHVPSEP